VAVVVLENCFRGKTSVENASEWLLHGADGSREYAPTIRADHEVLKPAAELRSSDAIPNDSLPIYHLRGNVSKYRTPDERKTYTDPINDGR
jgi:hypothetical protein